MAEREDREGFPLEAATKGDRSLLNSLWTSVASIVRKDGGKRILYTALESGAGTTLVTACSSIGLVRNTRTTAALVELNLAAPALASYLGLPTSPGLSELLDGTHDLGAVTSLVPGSPGLTVLPAGTPRAPVPGEFAAKRLGDCIEQLRGSHECLFVDAPPILTHPETRLLLEFVDGVIIVFRARSTPKRKIAEVERLLEDMNVPILGSILNRYRSDMPFGLD